MDRKEFRERLTELRMQKDVSARDMSLSMGQSSGYINNIENGGNLPSMTGFFYICDYLGISPQTFFETENRCPARLQGLMDAAKGLNSEHLDMLITIAKALKK